MSVSSNFEPLFYHQAVHYQHWRDAIQTELTAVEFNNTWSVVPFYHQGNIPLAVNGSMKSSIGPMDILRDKKHA